MKAGEMGWEIEFPEVRNDLHFFRRGLTKYRQISHQ